MKKILNAIGIVFAFILSILLFITIIFIVYLLSIQRIASTDNISNVIENTDLVTLDNDNEVVNDIFDKLDVPDEKREKILESKEVKRIVGNILGSSIESNLKKDNNLKLSDEELRKIIDDNWDSITEELGIDLNKDELENFKDSITDNSSEINKIIEPSLTKIKENEKINRLIDISFNKKSTIISLLIVISASLLIALCRLSFKKMFRTLGIATLLAGNITIFLGLLVRIFNFDKVNNELITSLILSSKESSSIIIIIYGIIIILLSIVCFIISKYLHEKNEEKDGFLANTTLIDIGQINK